jgi:hypothetical protein
MTKEYWQIAAGTAARDYSDRFIQFGMAFVGGAEQTAAMSQVAVGDIIILKRGLDQIVAVGEVVERNGRHNGNGDKYWLRDLDGWDLSSYCFVDWRVPAVNITTEGLTRSTIQKVPQSKHRQIADSVLALSVQPVAPEPVATSPIDDNDILKFLVGEGLRPSTADELSNTFHRIRLLAEYYYNLNWEDIREHESRTFLVIPLLLALGWAEQQLKLELTCVGGRVDIACFPRPYKSKKNDDECAVLIETKTYSSGLGFAHGQARGYAKHFPRCQVLVVTNGWCYKTFRRANELGDFSETPSAYLNILSPRDGYPLDPIATDGALGVLKWLLPHSSR